MRPISLMGVALLLVLSLLLAGCATSAEDRAFFQGGWLHPGQVAEQRMNSSPW